MATTHTFDLDVEDSAISPTIASRVLAWVLAVMGGMGFVASFQLTVEKFKGLADPNHAMACDFSKLVSCSSVMKAPEASLFGFPNSLLGIAAFAVIVATGAALGLGSRFHPVYWWGLIAGLVGSLGMVLWLVWLTMFELGTLCPWCALVWVSTIVALVCTAAYVTTSPDGGLAPATRRKMAGVMAYYPVLIIGAIAVLAAGIVLQVFA